MPKLATTGLIYALNFLILAVPVSIAQHPINVSVNIGAAVILNCTATGLPIPSITWYKQLSNGTLQPVAGIVTSVTGSVSKTSQLFLSHVTAVDAGDYVCTAMGFGNISISNPAYVNAIGTDYVFAEFDTVYY